jgi:pimeloyl-ACP methyl ester carboxylesterase
VVDLSTIPQEYVPYPGDGGDDEYRRNSHPSQGTLKFDKEPGNASDQCSNCTVHLGFMKSWQNTRPAILPHILDAIAQYPDYQLTLVGHSLGGAVAALASLEFQARGWKPQVTTFGEPRVGNKALMQYIDAHFNISNQEARGGTYRRVTHVNDPVPLLPLEEWGYRMHGGEIYISKPDLSPSVADLHHCLGDEDPNCIAGSDNGHDEAGKADLRENAGVVQEYRDWFEAERRWGVPPRYKLWELFFSHRDYFWRLGLCVPGGDPKDWYREYPHGPPQEL